MICKQSSKYLPAPKFYPPKSGRSMGLKHRVVYR